VSLQGAAKRHYRTRKEEESKKRRGIDKASASIKKKKREVDKSKYTYNNHVHQLAVIVVHLEGREQKSDF